MDFRSRFHEPEGAPRPRYESSLPSMARQEFAVEADINYLIDRYSKTGTYYDALSQTGKQPRLPVFDDFSEVIDMPRAVEVVEKVSDLFASLPSKSREQFGSVEGFVAATQNMSLDKLVELGVLEKKSVGTQDPLDVNVPTDTNDEKKKELNDE